MEKIKVMSNILANKIAAGEVCERPASVVKELVENSIDANSKVIKIELKEAGIDSIKIVDDGSGMSRADAENCFLRHATSKLLDEDDLYRINTLGFRGEALPSIAAVSKIRMKTNDSEVGTIIEMEAGEIKSIENGDSRVGTSINVNNLFYNVPARLKHLNNIYSELAVISEFINKVALARPDISFTLSNNDRFILKTDGSGNLLKVINSIYGLNVTKKMIEVNGRNDDYVVEGYISYPEVNRSSRNHIITIVNGRVVRNTEINRAINDSYHTFKPDNRYPIVVLKIEVEPSLIDVNIHPTKMDIKFSKKDELKKLLSMIIVDNLKHVNLIPEVDDTQVEEVLIKRENISFDLERKEEVKTREEQFEEEFNNKEVIKEEVKYYGTDIKEENIEITKKELPELYPIGSVKGTYIVCQNEKGMYLIDQHAAKERCNYEKYVKALGNPKNNTTTLLIPITIELKPDEYIILKENMELLTNTGFVIEDFGINTIVIKEHPIFVPTGFEQEAIEKLVDLVINKEKNFSVEKFREKTAIMMSCKLSIKANDALSIKEMENLISDLRSCDNPYTCPHGRPTIIHYPYYELEKLFLRVV